MSLMMDAQAAVRRLFGRGTGTTPPDRDGDDFGEAGPAPVEAHPPRERVPEMATLRSSAPPTA